MRRCMPLGRQCLGTSSLPVPRNTPPYLAPGPQASAGLVGRRRAVASTLQHVPVLPSRWLSLTHPRLPRLTTALGVELMPIPYCLKLQRSSRDLILIPFFSSPLSILFLFPPRPSIYPRCISPSDYSRVVFPLQFLYRFRLLTSQPWLPE